MENLEQLDGIVLLLLWLMVVAGALSLMALIADIIQRFMENR